MATIDIIEVLLRVILFGAITIQCIRFRKHQMTVSPIAFGAWGASALIFTLSFLTHNEYIMSATGSLLTASLCYLLLTWKVKK